MAKKISSRDKGARGERDVLKRFEEWWNPNNEENKKFFRTPGSGGLHTMGFRFQGIDISGDITTPDSQFPFTVEVKNCEGWHLEQLLTAPKSDIYKWWAQAVEETPEGRIPLLIFKKNRHPQLFAMRRSDFLLALPNPCVTLHANQEDVIIGLADVLFASDHNIWRNHANSTTGASTV